MSHSEMHIKDNDLQEDVCKEKYLENILNQGKFGTMVMRYLAIVLAPTRLSTTEPEQWV